MAAGRRPFAPSGSTNAGAPRAAPLRTGRENMTVREIMALAAELCGRKDLAEFLEGGACADFQAAAREEETLLRCYNLAENEIALDYLPIRRQEEAVSDGEIAYAELSKPILEIFSVRDADGEKLPYRAGEQGIRVRPGKAVVDYSYRPRVKRAGDEPEANGRADARVLALGTACEFALMNGMTETAALLDKRYRDALACACRERGGRLKLRRWA